MHRKTGQFAGRTSVTVQLIVRHDRLEGFAETTTDIPDTIQPPDTPPSPEPESRYALRGIPVRKGSKFATPIDKRFATRGWDHALSAIFRGRPVLIRLASMDA